MNYQRASQPLPAWGEAHRSSQALPLSVQRRERSQSKEPEVLRLDDCSSAAPRPPKNGAGPLPQPLSVRSGQGHDAAPVQLTHGSLGERLRALQPAPSAAPLWPSMGSGAAGPLSSRSCSSYVVNLGEATGIGSLRDPPPQPRTHSASPCRAGPSLARASVPVLSSASSASRMPLPSSRESVATLAEASASKAAGTDDEELTRRLYERFGLASCGVSLETFAHMHRARMAAMPCKAAGSTTSSEKGSTGPFGGA